MAIKIKTTPHRDYRMKVEHTKGQTQIFEAPHFEKEP